MKQVPQIFDRKAIAQRRRRAYKDILQYDFLIRHTAENLLDRLFDFKRNFENILVITQSAEIIKSLFISSGYRTEKIYFLDLVDAASDVLGDEELLPFKPETFDCVISHLTLPFVNDVPGVLAQIQYCLKPDGLFLGTTLGAETLQGLQQDLMILDLKHFNGAVQRVGPFVDIVDAVALMQRNGFALPVVDQEKIVVEYSGYAPLLKDLRGMGWASPQRRQGNVKVSKAFFKDLYDINSNGLEAVFEILTMTGWRPAQNQQQPLRPGSGEHSLAEALDTKENQL